MTRELGEVRTEMGRFFTFNFCIFPLINQLNRPHTVDTDYSEESICNFPTSLVNSLVGSTYLCLSAVVLHDHAAMLSLLRERGLRRLSFWSPVCLLCNSVFPQLFIDSFYIHLGSRKLFYSPDSLADCSLLFILDIHHLGWKI